MAQSVEQLIRNQQVAGSIPASSSKLVIAMILMIQVIAFFIREKSKSADLK